MSNFRYYPDESIVEDRYDEDVVYLVVSEKNWEEGVVFGFSTSYYSVAMQYVREHSDSNWVVTCM